MGFVGIGMVGRGGTFLICCLNIHCFGRELTFTSWINTSYHSQPVVFSDSGSIS